MDIIFFVYLNTRQLGAEDSQQRILLSGGFAKPRSRGRASQEVEVLYQHRREKHVWYQPLQPVLPVRPVLA